jgi:Na+/H+ antiporter NhaA/predicted DsbA family dithiol-disulfide isomerase
MATDTAFALGVLALVGPSGSMRIRVFLLTLVIIDDIGALLVIAFAYTEHISFGALLAAVGFFAAVLLMRFVRVRQSWPYVLAGIGLWFAMLESGVHPTIAGVALGLLATAYPPSRQDLQSAGAQWRLFREQPTPEYARSVRAGVNVAISPNERLQNLLHPWTSYLIVPLFALANAGVVINSETLSAAATSTITIGIIVALIIGKLVGITSASWLASRRRLGGFPLTVGWPGVLAVATVAGIGFTVSLFIADLSFTGERLDEAKLGILGASVLAALLSWLTFTVLKRLPPGVLDRAKAGTAEPLLDLADPVDPDRDHIRGSATAPVTLVEYADFQCPYCGQAEPVIRELLADFGKDLRYVYRHLPLTDVHRNAQLAAEAAEAAAEQGKFWEMHDLLFAHQDALGLDSLHDYAEALELDLGVFDQELRSRKYTGRIDMDVDSADRSTVAGTPTFFINGRRHYGAYDIETLTGVVRAILGRTRRPR